MEMVDEDEDETVESAGVLLKHFPLLPILLLLLLPLVVVLLPSASSYMPEAKEWRRGSWSVLEPSFLLT